MADFNNDTGFERIVDSLHEAALQTQFAIYPVSDGWEFCGADIEIGSLLILRMNLSFLTPTYFYAPAEITLRFDPSNAYRGVLTYRCGFKNNGPSVFRTNLVAMQARLNLNACKKQSKLSLIKECASAVRLNWPSVGRRRWQWL